MAMSYDKKIAVKHNDLIAVNDGLSIFGKKVVLSVLGKVFKEQYLEQRKGSSFYQLSIEEIRELIGWDSKNMSNKEIEKMVKKSVDSSFTIYPKEGGSIFCSYFVWAHIDSDFKNFTFKMDEDIKQWLFELKEHFTKLNIKEALKLKKRYSLDLYELLKSNAYKGYIEISIEDLKKKFSVENKYKRYSVFKQLLMKTIIEVNLKTSLSIGKIEEIEKIGKKVLSIRLKIKDKSDSFKQPKLIKTIPVKNKKTDELKELKKEYNSFINLSLIDYDYLDLKDKNRIREKALKELEENKKNNRISLKLETIIKKISVEELKEDIPFKTYCKNRGIIVNDR